MTTCSYCHDSSFAIYCTAWLIQQPTSPKGDTQQFQHAAILQITVSLLIDVPPASARGATFVTLKNNPEKEKKARFVGYVQLNCTFTPFLPLEWYSVSIRE
jgi:hypothetical protein